jgi:hypothetical protein
MFRFEQCDHTFGISVLLGLYNSNSLKTEYSYIPWTSPASMGICCYPPFRLTRQKIVTHLFATAPCNRFLFTSTSESAPRSIAKSRLSCIRQLHTRHPNAPSTLSVSRSNRATFTLLPHTGRSIWKFAFMQQLRWRKPPEDDEAIRQNEEEAAKEAILEKAFESRQPADLMLRCELLSTIPFRVVTYLASYPRYYSRRSRCASLVSSRSHLGHRTHTYFPTQEMSRR